MYWDYKHWVKKEKQRALGQSESEVIVLLLLLVIISGCSADASGWLSVVQQVQNVIHEVVLVRIFLVVKSCFKGLLKDGNNVGAICGRYEFKWALNLLNKLVATVHSLLLHINLVGNDNAGNVRALISHLRVPSTKILVSHLAGHVEYHYCNVSAEIVSWMQFIEWFLPGRVPDV